MRHARSSQRPPPPELTRRGALIAGAGTVLGLAAAANAKDGGAPPPARRVLSLNPCLDEVLVQVADRSQIVALSHYARDPHASTVADLAKTYPQTFESAEEVMLLKPDLVLSSRHSNPATRNALTQFGVRQELFGVPDTIAGSAAQVMRIATLVGHADRGAKLVGDMDAAIAAAAPRPGSKPITVLVFQPRGFAAGDGTLVSEMLTRTGFLNVASRYGVKQWGNVSLELLLANPPELLLSAEVEPGAPTWSERIVSHPALKAVAHRMRRAAFPERLLYCGGPTLIETARFLADARRGLEARA